MNTTCFFSMKPQIQHYNTQWPVLFENERIILEQIFGNEVEEIFHFGSTSVPGMAAKPIIDIKMRIHHMPPTAELLDRLNQLGYIHRETSSESTEKYMRFDKGDPIVTHCLHLLLKSEPDHTKTMRDYLRTHPDDVKEYSELKWRILSEEDNVSMLEYRDKKTPFLVELRKKSGLWQQTK